MPGPIVGAPSFQPPPPPPGDGGGPPPIDTRARLEFVGMAGTRRVTLTDTDNGFVVMPGVAGFGMGAYSLLTEEVPALDGAVLRGVRALPRDMDIPLYVEAGSRHALLAKLRDLANTLDPRYGPGELLLMEADGTGRRIGALYTGGLEGDEGTDVAGSAWRTVSLGFRALDPAWLDITDRAFRWTVAATDTFFPILPLTLISSQIIGTSVIVENPGDELAYPIWVVTGPATSIALTNNTTGAAFILDHSMADATHHVTIDTRPGRKTVLDETDTNAWPELRANPDLWSLLPGINSVDLAVSGTGPASAVDMTFTPRYKTAA